MQNPAALDRIAYEFAVDSFDDGVRYFEVRFAPQLHAHDTMTMEDVLLAVNGGLRRARDEYNLCVCSK
jgi:adenosine deaminase